MDRRKVLFVAHVENHLLNFHQPFFAYFRNKGWQVHTPVGAFLGRLAARLAATKLVVYTVHGFHFYQGPPPRAGCSTTC